MSVPILSMFTSLQIEVYLTQMHSLDPVSRPSLKVENLSSCSFIFKLAIFCIRIFYLGAKNFISRNSRMPLYSVCTALLKYTWWIMNGGSNQFIHNAFIIESLELASTLVKVLYKEDLMTWLRYCFIKTEFVNVKLRRARTFAEKRFMRQFWFCQGATGRSDVFWIVRRKQWKKYFLSQWLFRFFPGLLIL